MLLFQETTTTTDDDLFQGVRDFFDSDYWLVGRNVGIFLAVTFWLALSGRYKSRLADPEPLCHLGLSQPRFARYLSALPEMPSPYSLPRPFTSRSAPSTPSAHAKRQMLSMAMFR